MQPVITSIAVIDGGSGDTLALRTNDGSVSCGALLLFNRSYRFLTAGASEVTLNFGTLAALNLGTSTLRSVDVGDNSGTVTLNVGSSTLAVSTPATGEKGYLALNSKIIGTGGVVSFTRVAGTGTEDTHVHIGDSSASVGSGSIVTNSTYSGGTILGPNVRLLVPFSSVPNGSAVLRGPLGTGTLTLAGGTFVFGTSSSAPTMLGNALAMSADSTLETGGDTGSYVRTLTGPVNLSSGTTTLVGHRLRIESPVSPLKFDNAAFSASDVGTISFLTPADNFTDSDKIEFVVSTGGSTFGGTVGRIDDFANATHINGIVAKSGNGDLSLKHVRSGVLNINAGTLRIIQSSSLGEGSAVNLTGGTYGTSHVNILNFATDTNGAFLGKLDLENNDIIINYKIDDATTVVRNQIKSGWANGNWTGNGITSSIAQASAAGTMTSGGSFAIAYAQIQDAATRGLMTTFTGSGSLAGATVGTFSGQIVDMNAVGVKFTYYGDFNLDGKTDINDFSILALNFNTAQPWIGGDTNYDELADIGDFSLVANHFNAGVGDIGSDNPPLSSGGNGIAGRSPLPPLASLYMAMLDFPQIYWEARMRPDIWWRFEAFDAMNLGTIPAMPEGFRGTIPEPAGIAWIAAAGMAFLRRRGG